MLKLCTSMYNVYLNYRVYALFNCLEMHCAANLVQNINNFMPIWTVTEEVNTSKSHTFYSI